MLNIALCDDDKKFLINFAPEIEKSFKKNKAEVSVHTFFDGNKLIESFAKYKPYFDVVFLDIDMPSINGKEIAKRLRILDKKFKLIFVTSYEREALNTFQYDVIGFLPKTQIEMRMRGIIERVVKAVNDNNLEMQIFKVNVNDRITTIKVPLIDILYLESVNRTVYLYTVREKFVLHGHKFADLVEQFISKGFVDIHRTCIVNCKYIFSVDDIEVRLDNGTYLGMSRRKRQQVLNKFTESINVGDDHD